ncbi:MAG: response regulator [Vicinamibacterales bacterium]
MPSQVPTSRPRVLIADDEPDMRVLLDELCRARSLRATLVADGGQAIAAIGDTAQPFDIVVTDVQMPEADGFQVLAAARAVSPSTRVVLITGYGTDADRERALRNGASEYLLKPVSIVTIGEVLDRLADL